MKMSMNYILPLGLVKCTVFAVNASCLLLHHDFSLLQRPMDLNHACVKNLPESLTTNVLGLCAQHL